MSRCPSGEEEGASVRDPADPNFTDCGGTQGILGYGRQETLYHVNNTAQATTVQVEVFPWAGEADDLVPSEVAQIIMTVTDASGASLNTQPVVTINSPPDGSSVPSGTLFTFQDTANDTEDGAITAINWTSDVDGALGTRRERCGNAKRRHPHRHRNGRG